MNNDLREQVFEILDSHFVPLTEEDLPDGIDELITLIRNATLDEVNDVLTDRLPDDINRRLLIKAIDNPRGTDE